MPLIASSAEPAVVAAAQAAQGREAVSVAFERVLGDTAAALARGGVAGLVVAGGETSGAALLALGARALKIGPEVDPGVPLMRVSDTALALALKSGNFGAPDFFAKAAARMRSQGADAGQPLARHSRMAQSTW